ncbi:FAD:protein FMN transferase [Alphaproteobacteria bacterium GH1-50]|uniref:FAD:protein FMN transferase n=1 Tax=Kangsaoukella pontilimi TaxID=2691042 RepID=A0A7C9IIF5_9RHOB|nr:FAD:protein FMN transferase [Kangsaoukella pontilimi]MXQ09247.1 FAD:protein FMN transferase [Kangsaoukella pontilimi]
MTTRKSAPIFAPSRRTALGLIGATLLGPKAALAAGLESAGGRAFGTTWRMVYGGPGEREGLTRRIGAVLAEVDRVFSPWRADSDLSAFNAAPDGVAVADPSLAHVTAAALDIARRSGGAFDPTVGPLVARWGFGPIDAPGGGAPDWRGIRAAGAGIAKGRPDLTLDLCGIAKGWALDRVVELLRGDGVGEALVEIGGEFAAIGTHPEGRDWRVAVEALRVGQPPVAALRLAPGMAVATSGIAAQSYELNGRLYSHIIDPGTGAPAGGALGSVTVAAGDAMTADGWATALCAAGPVLGPEIARAEGVAALFVSAEDAGHRQWTTGAMRELVL